MNTTSISCSHNVQRAIDLVGHSQMYEQLSVLIKCDILVVRPISKEHFYRLTIPNRNNSISKKNLVRLQANAHASV